eukprot:jgi/Ulvmu1/3608/UM017_0020.1
MVWVFLHISCSGWHALLGLVPVPELYLHTAPAPHRFFQVLHQELAPILLALLAAMMEPPRQGPLRAPLLLLALLVSLNGVEGGCATQLFCLRGLFETQEYETADSGSAAWIFKLFDGVVIPCSAVCSHMVAGMHRRLCCLVALCCICAHVTTYQLCRYNLCFLSSSSASQLASLW